MDEQTPTTAPVQDTAVGMVNPEQTTPTANPPLENAGDALSIVKEVFGDKYATAEQAREGLRNLNRLVGDESTALQRRIVTTLAEKTGRSPEELADIIASEEYTPETSVTPTNPPTSNFQAQKALERTTRVELKQFLNDVPDARPMQERILQRSIATGKSPDEIWNEEYAPVFNAGKQTGAAKLQSSSQEQPTKGRSVDGGSAPQINWRDPNISSDEMLKHLPMVDSQNNSVAARQEFNEAYHRKQ